MKQPLAFVTFAVGVAMLVPTAPTLAQARPQHYMKPLTGYANPTTAVKWTSGVVARLRAPPGFRVTVFAENVGPVRMLVVAEDGTVYFTRRDSGDVIALREDGSGRAGAPRKVVANLRMVHGIAIHRGQLYLATVHEIYVAPVNGDGSVGTPRPIVTDLPEGAQHPLRTIAIGADDMIYVSLGSTCNSCVETNQENATIVRMALDGSRRGVYASGLRNTIGFDWHPQSGDLWGMDNGRDWGGNDSPPEELNKIQSAAHYGWPFCHADRRVDSLLTLNPQGSTKEAFCPRTVAPALTTTAHSAPIQLSFYRGSQFPPAYRGDAFVAMRGSWNRVPASGYKVLRIRFRAGQPVAFEDFLTGFLSADGRSNYGRLAGLAVARDGSLLVGDDTNGVIYRISYVGTGAP